MCLGEPELVAIPLMAAQVSPNTEDIFVPNPADQKLRKTNI